MSEKRTPKDARSFLHCENFARRANSVPVDWEPHHLEMRKEGGTHGVRLSFCPVVNGLKGKRIYVTKTKLSAFVTEAEERDERQRYEASTGWCGECFGLGDMLWSCSVTDGAKYRKCSKCKGSGVVAVRPPMPVERSDEVDPVVQLGLFGGDA